MIIFKVLDPGFLSTFQDGGFKRHEHLGMPSGGALDYENFVIANALVGQSKEAPILEMTAKGPKLQFCKSLKIAVTGCMWPVINGLKYPLLETIQVKEGDVLSFVTMKDGFRGTLAFSDDLILDETFSSKSTATKLGIGGYKGRKLTLNDEIIGQTKKVDDFYKYVKNPHNKTCRVVLGLENHLFKTDDFIKDHYHVSHHVDRMGIRLKGVPLKTEKHDIVSAPIVPGTIQLPPDGQPIVLMHDAQTTGGYTRIGKVIANDLPMLAQLKPDDVIQFEIISLTESKRVYRKWIEKLDNIEADLVMIKTYQITVNNQKYYVSVEV